MLENKVFEANMLENKVFEADNSLFLCDRKQIWAFPNGEFYSGYAGEKIFKFPACEFAIEYLNCGKDLQFEKTSYYNFWEDFKSYYDKIGRKVVPDFRIQVLTANWKEPFISSEQKCEKFISLIESIRTEGQKMPIEVFKVCDDVYLIIEGHHRICCNVALGKKTSAIIKDGVKKVWNLSQGQIDKVIAAFKSGGPVYEGNMFYHPPFWTSKKVKLLRESDKRLESILKDIVSLKGKNVLEVGCATGFFSASLNQIPFMEVTALDNDVIFANVVKIRKELTGHPHEVICGTIRNVDSEFDATLYIDAFFQTLEHEGIKEATYQFEKICEMTKSRVYFGAGYYPTLNKLGVLSEFYRKTFRKYGFSNVELLHYSHDESKQYQRSIIVARKEKYES